MYTNHNLATDIVDVFDNFLASKISKFLALIPKKKQKDMMMTIALVYMGWNIGIL